MCSGSSGRVARFPPSARAREGDANVSRGNRYFAYDCNCLDAEGRGLAGVFTSVHTLRLLNGENMGEGIYVGLRGELSVLTKLWNKDESY